MPEDTLLADDKSPIPYVPFPLVEFMVNTGLCLVLVTLLLGQMVGQISSAICMLDFTNNRFMTFTTWASLICESTGVMHAVYGFQLSLERLCGGTTSSSSGSSTLHAALWWIKMLCSLLLSIFSMAMTVYAIYREWTNLDLFTGAPHIVLVFFLLLLLFRSLMEALQIAVFRVSRLDEKTYRDTHPMAHRNLRLAIAHIESVVIGRQFWATLSTFFIASISSLSPDLMNGETVFGVPKWLNDFFITGLLGAVLTTVFGSLIMRVIASTYPLFCLNNPLAFLLIQLCRAARATGLLEFSHPLAKVADKLFGWQPDSAYHLPSLSC